MTDDELYLRQLLLHLREHYPNVRVMPNLITKCDEFEKLLESKNMHGFTQVNITYDYSQWPKIGI